MSKIILPIITMLVYLLIGTFLAGVFGPDYDDPVGDALFTLFWPFMLAIIVMLGVGIGLLTLTEKPVGFIKGLGQKLGEKVEGIFTKKKEEKIDERSNI